MPNLNVMKKIVALAIGLSLCGAAATQNYWPRSTAYTITSLIGHSFTPGQGPSDTLNLSYSWERCQTSSLGSGDCPNSSGDNAWSPVAGTEASLTIEANTITGNQRWLYRRCSTNSSCSDATLQKRCTAVVDIIFY